MKKVAAALSLALVVFAAPVVADEASDASAEMALLAEKRGGYGFIGFEPDRYGNLPDDPLDSFDAKELSGAEIGRMFNDFCLEQPFDYDAYNEAVGAHPDFSSQTADISETSIPRPLFGRRELPATQIVQNVSNFGISGFWNGDNAEALEGRYFLKYSGNLVVTGPFKAKDIYASQCNLTLRVKGLHSGTELLDTIAELSPQYSEQRRREKRKYAHAVWTGPAIDGRIPRISARASAFNKSEQTVHLTIQLLPSGKSN